MENRSEVVATVPQTRLKLIFSWEWPSPWKDNYKDTKENNYLLWKK